MAERSYEGTELEVFATAVTWKRYVRSLVAPYYGESVLEVGAGMGATTRILAADHRGPWLCVEPDPELCRRMAASGNLPPQAAVKCGTLEDLPSESQFDSILYLDVLEHIEDDRAEVERASRRLAPGGHLIILVPAHQFLYSPFDRAVGHFRRYSSDSLRRLRPASFTSNLHLALDSVGFWASLANRLLLRSAHPTAHQIRFWDSVLVPMSRILDRLLGYRCGKSLLAVWTKT